MFVNMAWDAVSPKLAGDAATHISINLKTLKL